MRALFFEAPGVVAIRSIEPVAEGVFVRGLASAVSQGTELLLYRGEGPTPFDPSMSAETYPTRYGYAWVGSLDGATVFGLLPHGDSHVVDRSRLRALPDVPAARATLAANLETAITCAWDAAPAFGERVVVLGGGVVGLLTAWILAPSADVVVIERGRRRCEAAEALGLHVGSVTAADIVIEATGDPAMLDAAISAARARVVIASFYGKRRAPVDLGDAFHRKRLQLVASQVSAIPPSLSPRWTLDRRFELVAKLLADERLDALITRVPFEDAPALYARLASDPDPPPCHVFEYA
jgi:hypothetical protein